MSKTEILFNKWCKIPDQLRFLFIGGVNACISYIFYVIAIHFLGQEQYQICVAIQWILSSVTSFINQKLFVFCTKGNWLSEYFKCCTTWVVSYCFNAVLLEIFVKYLIKNVYIAQLFSIFMASIVTYVLFKYFAFKQKKFS